MRVYNKSAYITKYPPMYTHIQYSETPLIWQSMGPKNNVGLGGCWIMEYLLPYLCMVTVPHIMVGLERRLDYRGVRLARFHGNTYTYLYCIPSHSNTYYTYLHYIQSHSITPTQIYNSLFSISLYMHVHM